MPPTHAFVRRETEHLLRRYLSVFRNEHARLGRLQEQLGTGEDLFARSNMRGHITASAIVLDAACERVLLVAHRFLRMWLPPGGHYEGPGSIWDSAVREVAEETGVTGIVLHPWCLQYGLPLDIDSHPIPANPKKGEDTHFHHDFRYLAIAREAGPLVPQEDEVDGVRWATFDELAAMPEHRMPRLLRKLEALCQLPA